MTTGRSGSTALMDCLEAFDDIAVPNKNVDCRDNELLLWRNVLSYVSQYTLLRQQPIADKAGLIEAFWAHNAAVSYAGFKAMPDHFDDFAAFCARHDVRFIVLIRRDIPATVASFMLALERQTWRRQGGQPEERWTFTRQNAGPTANNIRYLFDSHRALSQVPGAIRLSYEEFCEPGFCNAELEDFFGRRIALEEPRRPTDASGYVTNWDPFRRFVEEQWQRLEKQTTSRAR